MIVKTEKTINIFLFLVLVLIGIKITLNLEQNMDIVFGDEAEYLNNGLQLFKIIHKDWGPTYNIWYKILSFFETNKIALYYLNFKVTMVLPVLLLFILLIRLKIHQILAFIISFLFQINSLNVETWPRISHFVVILFLIAFILSTYIKKIDRKIAIYSSFICIAAFARPELYTIFILVSIVFLYFFIKQFKQSANNYLIISIWLLIVICLHIVYGYPQSTFNGIDRQFGAFCQHFSFNYKTIHHTKTDGIVDWIDFSKQQFPDCNSLFCIIKNHTNVFLENCFYNLKLYILILIKTFVSIIFPTIFFASIKKTILVFIAIIGILLFVLFNKKYRHKFFMDIKNNKIILITMLLFALPSFAACIIVFPRPHYILLQFPLYIFIISLLFNSFIPSYKSLYPITIILAIVLFFVTPKNNKYLFFQNIHDTKNFCDVKMVKFIENKKITTNQKIFTNVLNVSEMLPSNYTEFGAEFDYKRGMNFLNIIVKEKINIVYITPQIQLNKLENDTSWKQFVKNPAQYNFTKQIICDSCESYLLIKNDMK